MTELQPFRPGHLPALVDLWNHTFTGGPNFIAITEADLIRRVVSAVQFETTELLVAMQRDRALGFVHYGPRVDLYETATALRRGRREWQVFAVVASPTERALLRALLEEAVSRCVDQDAGKVLLYPSWVYGTQSMYNGIAGAYEYPGLGEGRHELLAVARDAGFEQIAEYGTPELDLSEGPHLATLRAEGERLSARAREWDLEERVRALEPTFFPGRRAVTLMHRHRVVAMTAYGPWEEYLRQYGRRLFGITSVQVEPEWRRRGLGKLVMIRAAEAAAEAGAEALHLHVYRGNPAAWNLYHKALGFEPKYTWVTMAKAFQAARH